MRTTLDIDPKLLEDVVAVTGEKTKKGFQSVDENGNGGGKQIEPYFLRLDLYGAHLFKSNSPELIFTEQTCLLS